jgi:L,D-peptidoglycan transpeptidase YkuD (ErfK/YbiS/YcfS/YnhG family)
MMPKARGLIFAATAVLVSPVYAEACPGPITKASRLVLVTTQSMSTAPATLQLFTRTSANKPWKRVSAAEAAVVGKAGLGWGYPFLNVKANEEPEKVEGDNWTPAGFFRIGRSFGFGSKRSRESTRLVYLHSYLECSWQRNVRVCWASRRACQGVAGIFSSGRGARNPAGNYL